VKREVDYTWRLPLRRLTYIARPCLHWRTRVFVASLSIYLGWARLSGLTNSTTAGAVWEAGCAQLSTPLA
jgi:hypothetical protein